MNARRLAIVLILLAVCTAGCTHENFHHSGPSTARQKAIDAGREFLLQRQQEDGSWVAQPEGFPGGSTALAVWALLESGSSPDDQAVRKGLARLRRLKSDKTYTVSVRANAYQAAVQRGAADFRDPLKGEVRRLVAGSVRGAYTYVVKPRVADISDQSNSHYAAMGVQAGVEAGETVPAEFWKQVSRYWVRTQNSDGGWPYSQQGTPSTPTMTAAAIATLGLCDRQMEGQDGRAREAIDKGLAWMKPRLEESLAESSVPYYYFLTLDRLERLTGRERIGDVDLSARAVAELLRRQRTDGGWEGSWGRDVSTAYALLVLSRQQ